MASAVLWSILVACLIVSTFGIKLCIFFIISTVFFITGFLATLYTWKELDLEKESTSPKFNFKTSTYIQCGIPKIVQQLEVPTPKTKFDKRLTGSTKIDEPLQEIIRLIFRYYVYSWYNSVSSNEEFSDSAKELIKNVINNFSQCAKEVDWVTFFTRKLIDDFASHLRLYRQSEKALKKSLKEQPEKPLNFESAFFDFELTMEKSLCRYNLCTSEKHEKRYLQFVTDMLLYMFLPQKEFKNNLLRYFLRDTVTECVVYPTMSLLADPDYINQNLIWLCKDNPLNSKTFLTLIRRSDSLDELSAVNEIAKHEIKVQNAKDTHDKHRIQQHIKSISFVIHLASQCHQKLLNHNASGDTDSIDLAVEYDIKPGVENKLIDLPFDIVLNNNIGLHYFTEFMTSIGMQGYVFFYHIIEGYRTTAETILEEDDIQNNSSNESKTEKLREFAQQIFDTYLGENAVVRVHLNELMLKKLYSRIQTDNFNENFFDEIQNKVYTIMQEEFYSTVFKDSPYYIKLLAELDLLSDSVLKDDDNVNPSKCELDKVQSTSSLIPSDLVITELVCNEVPSSEFCFPQSPSLDDFEETRGEGILTAEIYSTGITHHAGKTFAVYAIAVSHQKPEGTEEKWFIVRRYSEFYEFHKALTSKFPRLSSLEFPSKKTFNNLSRHVMEKRRNMLNRYLITLLSPEVLDTHDGLQIMLYNFLEPRICGAGKRFAQTVGTLVNPIRTSVKTVGNVVKLVPSTLFGLKEGLVKALGKHSNQNSSRSFCFETDKVSAGLDLDADDIPLRIMLLLLDEVFDLKNKDLWFRRRIIMLFRQIIKSTQGNAINQKIKDYVQNLMSTPQMAELLKMFSQVFWPSGIPAETPTVRDNYTKHRTRVCAKTLLLSSIPDEVKHIIGTETSYKGAMTIFNVFQCPSLNRRLLYVLMENILTVLFPLNNMSEIFEQIHCETSQTAPHLPMAEEYFAETKLLTKSNESIAANAKKFEPFRKLSWQGLDGYSQKTKTEKKVKSANSAGSTPVLQKKKFKETCNSVFYTDFAGDMEDIVILPLN